jgi:hypothetical protein
MRCSSSTPSASPGTEPSASPRANPAARPARNRECVAWCSPQLLSRSSPGCSARTPGTSPALNRSSPGMSQLSNPARNRSASPSAAPALSRFSSGFRSQQCSELDTEMLLLALNRVRRLGARQLSYRVRRQVQPHSLPELSASARRLVQPQLLSGSLLVPLPVLGSTPSASLALTECVAWCQNSSQPGWNRGRRLLPCFSAGLLVDAGLERRYPVFG